MAHKGELPQYQRLITAHNEDGKAVFAKIDETGPWDGSINGGTVGFSLGYTTSTTPVDMNDDKDMAQYKEYLVSPPGLVNKSGSVLRFVVSVSNSGATLQMLTNPGLPPWFYIAYAPHRLARLRCRTYRRNGIGSRQW
jgi:hypothetical protein